MHIFFYLVCSLLVFFLVGVLFIGSIDSLFQRSCYLEKSCMYDNFSVYLLLHL